MSDSEASVRYLNPDGLHRSPAYSQLAVVSGPVTTIYIGGQNAVNTAGELVGAGDLGAQVRQILENLRICLAAAGAGFEHIVKWTIYVVQGESLADGFAAAQPFLPRGVPPPPITVLVVTDLGPPGALAEIDAIAVVPASGGG